MTAPEISVYLPTRNRADLVTEAIQSVLDQTFHDFELIVVNDASTDKTADVLSDLSKVDDRIRVLSLPEKGGACAARNAAIEAAKGSWCTGLDDDDLMLPNRLGSLLEAARKSADCSLICSGFLVERNGSRREKNCRDAQITLDELLHRNVIGNQALFRRDRALAVGGFDASMPASQDYDFWTRLLERFGPARRIREASYVFREHDHATVRISNTESAVHGALRYTDKHKHQMTRAHLQSQSLIHHYVAGKPLTFDLARSAVNTNNIGFVLRYAARSVPLFALIRNRLG